MEEEEEDVETMAKLRDDKAMIEQALRDIAQSVIADADLAMALSDDQMKPASAVTELSESMNDMGLSVSPTLVLRILFIYMRQKKLSSLIDI